MKKVKLTSTCNVKGCEGRPGDVVKFQSDKQADAIIAGHGGVEVKDEPSGSVESK